MLISYVLRLVGSEAAEGRLVGEVEDVRSGRLRRIRDVDDLVAAIRDGQADAPVPALPEADA